VTQTFHPAAAHAQTTGAAVLPIFQVDASWPRPLPNNWTVGPVSGIAVDARDHIWIGQRAEAVKDAGGSPALQVKMWMLRRDTLQILGSFGGPGKAFGQFATSLHDMVVDSVGHLYTGEAASGGRVQKFTLQRIYFAGVTECVPEVQALRGVDVAFLAMNLPHERMTPPAAAECVRTFRPKVVYRTTIATATWRRSRRR
jgi:hypothetical protein